MEVVEMAMIRRNWRGIVAAASTCAVVATVTTAISAAASPAGRAGLARDIARSAAPANGDEIVTGVIDRLSPSIGFIGLGDSPTSTNGRAELVRTTNFGAAFTNIGPRTAKNTEPDSIFFLDSSHGWFATFSVATLKETIYRTGNGGRTWRAFAAPGHNVAAFSGDSLQFVSPTKGWLVDTVADAPAQTLYRTTDGGAHWQVVARLDLGQTGPGVLPELGQVKFEPNGVSGWLGGAPFGRALYHTADGGRTWRQVPLRVPRGSFGLPTVVGHLVIEPVTVPTRGAVIMRLYSRPKAGGAWSLFSSAKLVRQHCPLMMPTSLESDGHGWAAGYQNHHVFAWYTPDLGGVWRPRLVRAPVSPDACQPDQIMGQPGTSAWLVTPPKAGNGSLVYATANTGSTWHRIDLAALAAR
jgi:photosystem II stability/assembly factor-like uncharacterized protein